MAKTRRTPEQILATEKARLELDIVRAKRRQMKLVKDAQVKLSTYGAAAKNRLTEDWPSKTLSADGAIITDSRTLNARARAAERDNWMAKSAVRAHRRRVVGIGITPKSAAVDPVTQETAPKFDAFNRQVDWWWKRWARAANFCDVEKRKTFTMLERAVDKELVVVGESLAIWVYEPNEAMVGLKIQMIEPEQLDYYKVKNVKNGNEVRGGVELDKKTGAAVAYWIYTTGFDNYDRQRKGAVRVPAERVFHCYEPERALQTRGVTAFASSLVKMWHTSMYEEYQLIAARLEACQGGAIETAIAEDGTSFGLPLESGATGRDANNATEVVMEPGMMPVLPPGTKVNWRNLSRPGGQYDPFVKAQIRHVAASLGLDYAQVARDFSEGNFSSQRQGSMETDKELDPVQTMIVDTWGRPIRELFKLLAVMEGRVRAPGFFTSPEMTAAYMEDVWQGPPKISLEPLKKAAWAKIMLDERLITRRELANEAGRHVEDDAQQIAREREIFSSAGIKLPEDQPKVKTSNREPRPTKKRAGGKEDGKDDDDEDRQSENRDPVVRAVLEDEFGREVADLILSEGG